LPDNKKGNPITISLDKMIPSTYDSTLQHTFLSKKLEIKIIKKMETEQEAKNKKALHTSSIKHNKEEQTMMNTNTLIKF